MPSKISSAKKTETIKSKILNRYIFFWAAVSGVALFLSFPKYGSGIIAWIALIPLFWSLKDVSSIRHGLIIGFITGLIFHIGLIYWITYVIVNYGYLPIYLGVLIMLLLACYLSLYMALFAAGIVFFRKHFPLYLIAPVLWVCLECGKSTLFTGFPWENLGYSQHQFIYLIQIADVLGVFGLSFLVVLANSVLFEVITKRTKKELMAAAVLVLIIAAVLIYGISTISYVERIMQNAPVKNVALIQGNIDQSIKWDERHKQKIISIYEQLSAKNAVEGSMIIWPETAVPFDYQDVGSFQKRINEIALKTKSWLVFGSTSYKKTTSGNNYYNSAYLLSPSAEIMGKYDKVHLVPYGEYVPFREIFPFIRKLTHGMGDFTSGGGYLPLNADGRKIGILICYEGILPSAARVYKNSGAELLVNITNDAWFGATSAPFQHFSMSIFRAVETRLYLVRAANTGVSAIVDPIGRVVEQTNIFERATVKGIVKFPDVRTVYAAYGDVLVYFCFALVLLYFFLVLIRRKKKCQ